MVRAIALVIILGLGTGCATVGHVKEWTAADLRGAAADGLAARERGDLPDADRWPECFTELADRLDAADEVAAATPLGIARLAMRVHIAKAKRANPISAECAQVVLQLEGDLLELGSSFLPGGSVVPRVLRLLPR